MISQRKRKITEINHNYVKQQEKEQERLKEWDGKKRRGLTRRLTALGIITLVMLVISTVIISSQLSALEAKKAEQKELEQQLQTLKQEEQQLNQDIENYNDLDYIAEIARRDYYLSKPGETIFSIPGD